MDGPGCLLIVLCFGIFRMKTVQEKTIHERLDVIRDRVDKGLYGKMCGAKETADQVLSIVAAQIRENVPESEKTAPDKDAWVKRQPEYAAAVQDKANAYADWKTAETYMKLSFADFDIWRSEEATNRGLDRRSGG